MERTEVRDTIGELKLCRSKAAYDETLGQWDSSKQQFRLASVGVIGLVVNSSTRVSCVSAVTDRSRYGR